MATTAHMKKSLSIPLFISTTVGTVLLGMLSGLLSGSKAGYSLLVLPPATPPDAVFPVVWSVLYAMIGLSLFFIMRTHAVTESLQKRKTAATALWFVQFGFLLLWPFAFFTFKLYIFSFLWIVSLWAISLALIICSFRVSPTAGALLIPYEAWLTFAVYLNLFIAMLN